MSDSTGKKRTRKPPESALDSFKARVAQLKRQYSLIGVPRAEKAIRRKAYLAEYSKLYREYHRDELRQRDRERNSAKRPEDKIRRWVVFDDKIYCNSRIGFTLGDLDQMRAMLFQNIAAMRAEGRKPRVAITRIRGLNKRKPAQQKK